MCERERGREVSKMMRVLAADATADPTKIEMEVRERVWERESECVCL